MKTLKYRNTGNDVDRLQSLLDIPTNSSHEFDMVTNDKVVEFQKAHGLVADGIVGYRTWEALLFQGEHPVRGISDEDFNKAASLLECESAALKAVQKVETGGKGGSTGTVCELIAIRIHGEQIDRFLAEVHEGSEIEAQVRFDIEERTSSMGSKYVQNKMTFSCPEWKVV